MGVPAAGSHGNESPPPPLPMGMPGPVAMGTGVPREAGPRAEVGGGEGGGRGGGTTAAGRTWCRHRKRLAVSMLG